MEIRGFEPSDAQAVGRIDTGTIVDSIAVISGEPRSFTWTARPLAAAKKKGHDVGAYLQQEPRPWSRAVVAVRQSRIVGFAAFGLQQWNRRLILWHMYVDHAARRLGVGKALLEAAIDDPLAQDARHIWLETQDDNVPAIAAYEHLGFELVGIDTSLYSDAPDGDIAVFMRRTLQPSSAT